MSFDALAWAARQNTGSAGTKLVLLGLAECAHRDTAEAYPSIAALVEFSSMDRKSVIANLNRLEAAGFVADTGKRAGKTKQVKVYRLALQRVPKAEQSQKRNSTDISAKQSQKRDTDTVREPVIEKAKASSIRTAKPKWPVPAGIDPEHWADFLENRKTKRLGFTDTALRGQLRELQKLSDDEWPPGRLVQHAAERGWGAIHDPRTARGHHDRNTPPGIGRTAAAIQSLGGWHDDRPM